MIVKSDKDSDSLERLFAAARKSQPYGDKVEYGFETRVMARIREKRDSRKLFSFWTWRLIPALVVLVLMLGSWTFLSEHGQLTGLSPLMGINGEEIMLVASLTGE